jgi:predicted nucleotide-binding protein
MKLPYPAVVSALDKLEGSITVYLNAHKDFLLKAAPYGPDREQEQRLSKDRVSMIEVETVETYVESFCREKDQSLKYFRPVRALMTNSEESTNRREPYLSIDEANQVQLWIKVTRFNVEMYNKSADNTSSPGLSSKEVFIVHGRDEETKNKVARFIETELRYTSVILHEKPNIGRNILTKFLEESRNAVFVVVLMTPDDVGGLATTDLKNRARQNVIFELGFFIGKFGADRVAALVKGDLETPSDFDGIGYIKFDPDGGWRFDLLKEISRAVTTTPSTDGYFIS